MEEATIENIGKPILIKMTVTEVNQIDDSYLIAYHNRNMSNSLHLTTKEFIPHIGDQVIVNLSWKAKKYSLKRKGLVHKMRSDEIDKVCANCVHFNLVPNMSKTGICDANELNRRVGVPVVLTGSKETCWLWEYDKHHNKEIV